MAISWWMATGINQKMSKDIRSLPGMHKYFDGSFWIRPTVLERVALTIDHILPIIIILGVGLLLSISMFLFELWHQRYTKKDNRNVAHPTSRIRPVESCNRVARIDI